LLIHSHDIVSNATIEEEGDTYVSVFGPIDNLSLSSRRRDNSLYFTLRSLARVDKPVVQTTAGRVTNSSGRQATDPYTPLANARTK
jgi:hypothetical protein